MAISDELAQRWLKARIKRELGWRQKTYADLVRDLAAIGVPETEVNLRNKMSRGTFSAAFFVQCLAAIGVEILDVDLLDYARETAADAAETSARATTVSLAWSHTAPPVGHAVIQPEDVRKGKSPGSKLVCGNCGETLFRDLTIGDVERRYKGKSVIGRCQRCRAFVDLPGSLVHLDPPASLADSLPSVD